VWPGRGGGWGVHVKMPSGTVMILHVILGTHRAVVGIALQPSVAAAVKAGAWAPTIRGEVAAPASLKTKGKGHVFRKIASQC
jgi:hypothetical protein